MRSFRRSERWLGWVGAVAFSLAAGGAPAEDKPDAIVATGEARAEAAAASQAKIDEIAEATRDLTGEYKAALKVIEGLKVYNGLLQQQVDAQRAELADIDRSIEEVAIIERQVMPLMLRMLDAAERFVELDMPFLLQERRDRIAKRKALLADPNVSVAEKFREVLEVFQIENEYGRTIEAWTGTLDTGNAQAREVNFLRIGRVVLTWQSPDGTQTGAWDPDTRTWVELPAETYRRQVALGLAVARKQAAPDLLTLPVSVEGGK